VNLLMMLATLLTRGWSSFLNLFTTRSADEFERFKGTSLPGNAVPFTSGEQAPSVVNVAPMDGDTVLTNPAECEETFTRLLSDSRYHDAWELLTPDSQVSWGQPSHFVEEMKTRQTADVMGSKVREVRLLPEWTDQETRKTYRQVAELVVDYSIRHQMREVIVQRNVHVVNVRGGWKSLCYRSA
jgi:hypothetical protein